MYNQQWKTEYKEMKNLKKEQIDVLENGPKSLTQAWMLSAMQYDYRRMKLDRQS